jgi:hypothetical protein
MNNNILGKLGAVITGLAVFSFAVSMIIGLFLNTLFASCLSSFFIAIGFIALMIATITKNHNPQKKAVGLAGIAFAIVYAVIIFLVYYAECTTVRMNPTLSSETLSIISFGHTGSLFFNYDLLGYAFMGLSTFLTAFTVEPKTTSDKVFRGLLWWHGIFFFPCLIIPMFPIFTNSADALFPTILLEFWCVYFLVVCFSGLNYFRKKRDINNQ